MEELKIKKNNKATTCIADLFQEVILDLDVVKASLPHTPSMLRIFRKIFSSAL